MRAKGSEAEITKNYGTRIKLYTTPFVLVMKVTHATHPNSNGSVRFGVFEFIIPIRWSYGETEVDQLQASPDRILSALAEVPGDL